MSKVVKKQQSSRRAQAHEEMLKEAQARPGVREVMEVYNACIEKSKGMHAYRSATGATVRTKTSNSTNLR